jgi:Putative zinc-finger
MNHQNLKGWLEEYAELGLPPENARDVERHLAICKDCQEQLRTIRLTRGIVRASRLREGPEPAPGFARAVLRAIEQQRESYLGWAPLRMMALKFLPVVATLAVAIGLFAYFEISSTLNARQLPQEPLLESSLELSSQWGQEVAVFSDGISQDQEQVLSTLLEGQQTDPQDRGKDPQP